MNWWHSNFEHNLSEWSYHCSNSFLLRYPFIRENSDVPCWSPSSTSAHRDRGGGWGTPSPLSATALESVCRETIMSRHWRAFAGRLSCHEREVSCASLANNRLQREWVVLKMKQTRPWFWSCCSTLSSACFSTTDMSGTLNVAWKQRYRPSVSPQQGLFSASVPLHVYRP